MHGIKFKKAIADLRARSKVALAAGAGLRKIHAAQSGGKQIQRSSVVESRPSGD
jgi:hypothetical protein